MARSKVTKGLDKLERRLSDPDWIRKPAGELLRAWVQDVRRYAAEHAPEWRRDLIRSIETQTDSAKFPLYARVFTEEPQGRWMEYGTGLLSEDPLSKHRRHRPPAAALEPWATDHGLNPYAVAEGIYRRGGLEPRHYFRDAEAHADRNLNRYLGEFAAGIERGAEAA